MGQKVNPVGMRIGITKNWNSRWFAKDKDYATFLNEDIAIRNFLNTNIKKDALLSHIEIERKTNDRGNLLYVMIFAGRPGLIIGENGAIINDLTEKVRKIAKNSIVKLNVVEIKQPDLDAKIVGEKIAIQLENRASFRIVQKKAIAASRKAGAKGIKTSVSGRLAGADIARSEGYKEGTMAINTLRSDIDYAWSEAMTTYGKLGIKVWICRGEVETQTKEDNKKGE